MLMAFGRSLHALAIHRVAASDNSTPATPPARQINKLSIKCARMSVNRGAPSAPRIAISFCRAAPRATRRLATFRHPISNMHATAHINSSSGFLHIPRQVVIDGPSRDILGDRRIQVLQMQPELQSLYLAQSAGQAYAGPQARHDKAEVVVMVRQQIWRQTCQYGIHTWIFASGQANHFGRTPTTVYGLPSRWICLPIIDASPPNLARRDSR